MEDYQSGGGLSFCLVLLLWALLISFYFWGNKNNNNITQSHLKWDRMAMFYFFRYEHHFPCIEPYKSKAKLVIEQTNVLSKSKDSQALMTH